MREDHCIYKTNAFGNRRSDDGGEGGEEARSKEEGAELAFQQAEFDVEEIGHPRSEISLFL